MYQFSPTIIMDTIIMDTSLYLLLHLSFTYALGLKTPAFNITIKFMQRTNWCDVYLLTHF